MIYIPVLFMDIEIFIRHSHAFFLFLQDDLTRLRNKIGSTCVTSRYFLQTIIIYDNVRHGIY